MNGFGSTCIDNKNNVYSLSCVFTDPSSLSNITFTPAFTGNYIKTHNDFWSADNIKSKSPAIYTGNPGITIN